MAIFVNHGYQTMFKGEALISNCVGRRPTLLNQHPYQALKGRHHGMGYGCRPFRAYGVGGIFIVGRCPTQGGCRPFRAYGVGWNFYRRALPYARWMSPFQGLWGWWNFYRRALPYARGMSPFQGFAAWETSWSSGKSSDT